MAETYGYKQIADALDRELHSLDTTFQKLSDQVESFISETEEKILTKIEMRQRAEDAEFNAEETRNFFRSQERNENTRLILQYLLSFSRKLPEGEDIKKDIVNPFSQLKAFIRYNTSLLKEQDVKEAILREYKVLGILNENNLWYYKGRIDKKYKEIMSLIHQAEQPKVEDYCKLFQALQGLSLFWFSARNENQLKIRKSDMYIYQLAGILLKKYQYQEKPMDSAQ